MKKILASTAIVLFLLALAPTKTFAHEIDRYTPQELAEWLSTFSYDYERASSNSYDCYALPLAEFVVHKKGTCKDFAYSTALLLKEMGYSAFYVYWYDTEYPGWHVVTAYQDKGIYIFDFWELSGPYDSIEEISRYDEYVRPAIDPNMCVWR